VGGAEGEEGGSAQKGTEASGGEEGFAYIKPLRCKVSSAWVASVTTIAYVTQP
jgi:hypothetical protein